MKKANKETEIGGQIIICFTRNIPTYILAQFKKCDSSESYFEYFNKRYK